MTKTKLNESVPPAGSTDRALLHPSHRWLRVLYSPSYPSCSSKSWGDHLDDDHDDHDDTDNGDDDCDDYNGDDPDDAASMFFLQRMLQLTVIAIVIVAVDCTMLLLLLLLQLTVTGADVGTALAAKSNIFTQNPSLSNPTFKVMSKE